ncbi:tyrosine-protein phosphatase [Marinomonas polaris]|uniref:Cyclin-dependent kinase inhibitor 3 (CDKN3) n=1 Tax=Marinomonas polaris DSM 16579 TaxID=1122206 RepID=A0A1M5KT36_9GAMM|nr:tyrosine-protein phosphatase [Marinomonas polaris]SHG55964.1 Cyclin-dependent kinase inhibitor 3 (CDKN3) [Marinomonas polaris DSM 16579]
MNHPFDVLKLENGAAFIFTPCPGTKEANLATSVACLKSAGATAVISLLPDQEIETLGVTELGKQVTQQNMTWYQLPIEDDQAPKQPFFAEFEKIKNELLERLRAQEKFAIHCRGGSGRTGLMAAILLLELGQPWQQVQELIQGTRPKALTLAPHIHFLKAHYSI